jgi:hypothetical protein
MNEKILARERERARANAVITTLLTKHKLSQWEAGMCFGLRTHVPNELQWQALSRLQVKYNIDAIEQEQDQNEHPDRTSGDTNKLVVK